MRKNIEWLKLNTLRAKADLLEKRTFGGYEHGYMDALSFFEDMLSDIETPNNEAETDIGTFENQFNRKMNQLIKAIESPNKVNLQDIIIKMDNMNIKYRTEWVNRIALEFASEISTKTLLGIKKEKRVYNGKRSNN